MTKWKRDLIWGTFLSLGSIAVFFYGNTIEERQFAPPLAESGLYIQIWAIILFILAVALIIKSILVPNTSQSIPLLSYRIVFTLILIVIYFVLLPKIGFCLSTGSFLSILILYFHYLGNRKDNMRKEEFLPKISQYVIISAILTGFLYLIFAKILHVILP